MSEIDPVLQRYPPDCRPSHVEPLGSAGGMSGAHFWRISAPRGTLVLRRWPIEHPTPERLRFIHAVLRHAALKGAAHLSLPVLTRDAQTFVSHARILWELAPWLSGAADYERAPTAGKLRAALKALARFHLATADYPIDPAIIREAAPRRHLMRLRELNRGEVNQISRSIIDTTWPELVPLARQFLAALPGATSHAINQLEPLADVTFKMQPCIRDIWHDHVLFSGDKVTGLIDFGALDIDTPATDIARLAGSLAETPLSVREGPGEGSASRDVWQLALAAYSAIRPLSRNESVAVSALHASGTILAGCNWIRWIYVERRQFENPAQVMERFRRITSRVATASESRSDDIP